MLERMDDWEEQPRNEGVDDGWAREVSRREEMAQGRFNDSLPEHQKQLQRRWIYFFQKDAWWEDKRQET